MLTRDVLLGIACLALMILIPLLIYILTLVKRELEQDQHEKENWYHENVIGKEER